MTTMIAVRLLDDPPPSRPGCRAAVRVVPVPRSEPPTDAERAATGADLLTVGPALPLELPPAAPRLAAGRLVTRTPGRFAPAVPVIAEPATAPLAGGADDHSMGRFSANDGGRPGLAAMAEPADVRAATRRFLATCVEVIGGFRPVNQLRPLCLPESFAQITERLAGPPVAGAAGRSRGAAMPGRTPVTGRCTGGPPKGGRSGQTGPPGRVYVRRVQVCEVAEGVAEVAVVLERRERVWAMALRFEQHGERWLCSWLEVL